MFANLIIFSKLTLPGIEATMQSITQTALLFNVTCRALMGVLVNKLFFHADEGNLPSTYVTLKFISLAGSLAPFLFMSYFIPTLAEAKAV